MSVVLVLSVPGCAEVRGLCGTRRGGMDCRAETGEGGYTRQKLGCGAEALRRRNSRDIMQVVTDEYFFLHGGGAVTVCMRVAHGTSSVNVSRMTN